MVSAHVLGAVATLFPLPEAAGGSDAQYVAYADAYKACMGSREGCVAQALKLVEPGVAREYCEWVNDLKEAEEKRGLAEPTVCASVAGSQQPVFESVSAGCPERGTHYKKNKRRREAAKVRRQAAAESCASDGVGRSVGSACTVDTRTAVEIEASQTLAARRVAENQLAVKQMELKMASYNDAGKAEAVQRLSAARYEQRINEARLKSQNSYKAQDKSLTSVDSSGSAGEYALRQQVKEARNSQFVNEFLRKQVDFFAERADPSVVAAADRMPRPKLDDMYDVMKEQYQRMGPEQRARFDEDVAVANSRWNDFLYSGEGFVDDVASDSAPVAGESLEEMIRKGRLQGEMLGSSDPAERAAAEKIKI